MRCIDIAVFQNATSMSRASSIHSLRCRICFVVVQVLCSHVQHIKLAVRSILTLHLCHWCACFASPHGRSLTNDLASMEPPSSVVRCFCWFLHDDIYAVFGDHERKYTRSLPTELKVLSVQVVLQDRKRQEGGRDDRKDTSRDTDSSLLQIVFSLTSWTCWW